MGQMSGAKKKIRGSASTHARRQCRCWPGGFWIGERGGNSGGSSELPGGFSFFWVASDT